MGINRDFQEWTEKLEALLVEAQSLRHRISDMEKQNALFQERLINAGINSDGEEALRTLYGEGFHICHTRFAQVREGDCLFCLSIISQLAREGKDANAKR